MSASSPETKSEPETNQKTEYERYHVLRLKVVEQHISKFICLLHIYSKLILIMMMILIALIDWFPGMRIGEKETLSRITSHTSYSKKKIETDQVWIFHWYILFAAKYYTDLHLLAFFPCTWPSSYFWCL